MLRRSILVITIVSLLVPLTSCSKSLSLKAAIVYKMGGAQPVARVPFFLLDDDLEDILQNAGIKSSSSTLAFDYGLAMRYSSRHAEDVARMQEAIKPHIIKSATTDFDGTAKFDSLRPGTYYLVGVAETRGGFAVWNQRVEVDRGSDTIILDQNNAAYAS